MTRWTVEAWTLPGSVPFQRRVMDVPGELAFTVPASGIGRIAINVPSVWDRLDDVLDPANDVGSLLRLYETDRAGARQIRGEFPTRRTDAVWGEGGDVTITAPSIEDALEEIVTFPYDYPPPIVQPDWKYGADEAAGSFSDGGMESTALFNGDAETGSTQPWSGTQDDAIFTPPTLFEVNDADPDTGVNDFYIEPGGLHSGMATSFNVYGGKQIVITARLKEPTGAGRRYTMYLKMGDGSTMSVGQKVWSGYALAELDAAAYEAGASDGTYQDLAITVTYGADVSESELIIHYDDHDGGTALPFYVDNVTIQGAGFAGWEGVWQPYKAVDTFEFDTTIYRTGTRSLKFKTGSGSPAFGSGAEQRVTGLTPGVTYTLTGWMRHDSGSLAKMAMIARRPGGVFYGSQVVDVPTGTDWTVGYLTFTADTDEVWCDFFHNAAGASPNWYLDDVLLAEGLPPSTVGEIVGALLDDAQTDHTGETGVLARATGVWIKPDFTDTDDSAGNAWRADESVTIRMGKTYGKVLSDFAQMGYEYRIRPNPSYPSDSESHILQIFNPSDPSTRTGGASVDLTGSVGFSTATVTAGQIVRRPRTRTVALAAGEGNLISVAKDGVAAWGAKELFVPAQDVTDTGTLDQAAATALVERGTSTEASQITILDDDHFSPFIDFQPGDWVRGELGGQIPRGNHRVAAITGDIRGGLATFTLDLGAQVFVGASGTEEGVRRLLAKFDGISQRDDKPSTVAQSGKIEVEPAFLVAASNAHTVTKAVAHFQCSGAADEDEIQYALDSLPYGGRVRLSEGDFFTTSAAVITLPTNTVVEGLGKSATRINHTGTAPKFLAAGAGVEIRRFGIYPYGCT